MGVTFSWGETRPFLSTKPAAGICDKEAAVAPSPAGASSSQMICGGTKRRPPAFVAAVAAAAGQGSAMQCCWSLFSGAGGEGTSPLILEPLRRPAASRSTCSGGGPAGGGGVFILPFFGILAPPPAPARSRPAAAGGARGAGRRRTNRHVRRENGVGRSKGTGACGASVPPCPQDGGDRTASHLQVPLPCSLALGCMVFTEMSFSAMPAEAAKWWRSGPTRQLGVGWLAS